MTELTDDSFRQFVTGNVPQVVLVDFYATWCPPCKAMEPVLKRLEKQYTGKVLFGRVNIDDHKEIAKEFEIQSIPTLILFVDNEVVGQITGAVSREKVEKLIDKGLASFSVMR